MNSIALILVLVFSAEFAMAENAALKAAKSRCSKKSNAPILYRDDVGPDNRYTLQEVDDLGRKTYFSEKRIKDSFYYSEEHNGFVSQENGKTVVVPDRFITKVTDQLAEILKRNYARSLFHTDIGHGHFNIPDPYYRKKIDPLPGGFTQKHYDLIINHPDFKILYHAAESLNKVGADGEAIEIPAHRHYIDIRNIVGHFNDKQLVTVLPSNGTPHNTRSGLPGMYGYGSFDFSWNKNGCFPVSVGEQTVYVDMSFSAIGSAPRAQTQNDEQDER